VAYSTANWTDVDSASSFSLNCFPCNVSIPDANFKAYLVGNTAINTNGNAEIECSEATAFTGAINCPNLNISDLTGIEAFGNITELYCYDNQLTGLDISQNTSLTNLHCGVNQLTSLNLNQNISLAYLNCYNNQLTNLNLSLNTSLTELHCDNTQLTNLDVSQNTLLTIITCGDNQLTGLDISQCTSLEYLSCRNNQLTSLNLNQNSSLTDLVCFNNQLTSLNLSQNSSLTDLFCRNNQLTSLDLSQNTALTRLGCGDNQLTSLNVANGNNANVVNFNTINTPNLTCILVDDAAYSTANWTDVDLASTFVNSQAECNALSTETYELNNSFSVYPNPSQSYINIGYNKPIDRVEIYNILGEKVLETSAITILTNTLTNGVYFIKLYAGSQLGLKRFVKQ